MDTRIKILTVWLMVWVTGCTTHTVKRDPAYAAVRPVAVPPQPSADGAIFNANYNVSLFEDYRARRVGDILTVKLEEKTQAEKSSTTTISKESKNSVTNPTILGTTPQFDTPGILPLASHKNNNLGFNLTSKHSLNSKGDNDQANKLTGFISVSVVEVLPNGNLVVRGEKVMSINQGNEYIRLSGIISPRDIDANNTISSKRIADAQLSYVGDGPTNDANVMGWLSRFFISALMPF